ncbi:hypothetical protein [Cupriavidus numazuensis]|uniref:Uncharacterized protein n=1 Tax=Cupriavidus numazuensis TaxID=221992 RepID=A0ABM8TUW8_9BURK|nr:hypothetical protein [Cupriavidus numazuensis]CAG2160401.1 hypothetical protein LMG26411_07461 [Cupriavidus numazuensis]
MKHCRARPVAGIRHVALQVATLLVACVGLASLASAAPLMHPRRLQLAVFDPQGVADGSQCDRVTNASEEPLTPVATLSEADVIAWDAAPALWALDAERFPVETSRAVLGDHCFVLSIDGKRLVSGVILPVDSDTLSGYPTINVIVRNGTVVLQLTTGNHHNIRLMLGEELDAVLGNQANLAHQAALIRTTDSPATRGNR